MSRKAQITRKWAVKDGDRIITSFALRSDAKAFVKLLTNKNVTIVQVKGAK